MAEKKKASGYTLDPRNARKHPDRNKDAVSKSLHELGAGRSIVVDADGVVIGGNAVYEQAIKLGLPVEEIESKGDVLYVIRRLDLHTNDPKRKALALMDNKAGDTSEFDFETLAGIMTELDGVIDLELTGFLDFETGPLLEGDWSPPVIDDLDGASKEPKTATCPECGHLFEL